MSDCKSELHGTVLGIVNDIEAAVEGNLYKDGCGNTIVIEDMDEWKEKQYRKKVREFRKEHPDADGYDKDMYDSFDEYMEDEIGTADDIDEPDEVSLYDYINDNALGDIRFEVDSSKEMLGGKILFCYGGPNVWVHDDQVCGYWGGDTVEMALNSQASSAMFSFFNESWEMIQ